MWTRFSLGSALMLVAATAASAGIQEWAQRPDRILIVLLADGLDPHRVAPSTERGDPLCSELSAWKSACLRYSDVQSGNTDPQRGLEHLFGATPPAVHSLEEVEELALELRSERGPSVALFATDSFANVQTLSIDELLEYDPAPWLGAGFRDDNDAIARKRRSRATQILSQLRSERRLHAILPAPELQWVPDALHRRGDAALAEWFTAFERAGLSERCLIVLTARAGAMDPLRGGSGQGTPPRPDLLRVPFWIRGSDIEAGIDDSALRSGTLMAALSSAQRSGEWSPPNEEPERWSTDWARGGDTLAASAWIRHERWSVHFDHEGRDAVYDRRIDPAEWDNLAPRQEQALAAFRQRASQALLGSIPELVIHNNSGRTLLLQPPEAVVAISGGESKQVGSSVELSGEGPWTIQFEPALELTLRAPGETTPLWAFPSGAPLAARQIQLRLGRYEFFAALTLEAPADAGARSAPAGTIQIQLNTTPEAADLLR